MARKVNYLGGGLFIEKWEDGVKLMDGDSTYPKQAVYLTGKELGSLVDYAKKENLCQDQKGT